MLYGTKSVGSFSAVHLRACHAQWAFAESLVRPVYPVALEWGIFHSRYVRLRKVLKGSIKLRISELAIFCRLIPISLWGGSLLAVVWGVTPCQLAND